MDDGDVQIRFQALLYAYDPQVLRDYMSMFDIPDVRMRCTHGAEMFWLADEIPVVNTPMPCGVPGCWAVRYGNQPIEEALNG